MGEKGKWVLDSAIIVTSNQTDELDSYVMCIESYLRTDTKESMCQLFDVSSFAGRLNISIENQDAHQEQIGDKTSSTNKLLGRVCPSATKIKNHTESATTQKSSGVDAAAFISSVSNL